MKGSHADRHDQDRSPTYEQDAVQCRTKATGHVIKQRLQELDRRPPRERQNDKKVFASNSFE